MRRKTHDVKTKVPNVASFNKPGQNMNLNLNIKYVVLQMKRCQEVLRTAFLVTTKKTSQKALKKTILELTQRRFGKFVFWFWCH